MCKKAEKTVSCFIVEQPLFKTFCSTLIFYVTFTECDCLSLEHTIKDTTNEFG